MKFDEEIYRRNKEENLAILLREYCKKIDWIWVNKGSRRKVVFQIDDKNRLGFFAEKSHNLIEIDEYILAEEKILQLILPLKNLLKKVEENLFINASITLFDSGCDIILSTKRSLNFSQIQQLINFAQKNNLNISSRIGNQITPIFFSHKNQIFYPNFKINLDGEIFIQPTILGLQSIIKIIRSHILKPIKVIDIYSGFGAYSFGICDLIKSVLAVEGNNKMIDLLNKNAAANGFGNKIQGEVRDLFLNPLTKEELKKFDLAIINPPRNGASPQISNIAISGLKNLIYVSCNPQSFKRDAKILIDLGFHITSLTALDQFYSTKHLELIAKFELI